ncbi:hypothetical protein [Mesorhizobium sp. M00.F.Ca.ET.216.01.1.1]|uniref:hypothetical protein n=1 Tax=Mesorhizobium sp. M00.F.Ca.ET.216.01.1.1 TaxID=2500528 RepID=UPI000FDCA1C6|nr:hypothetical protein [Mesorhizobium sp. M00.F.Ca.ET.216.01.1.1]TGQ32785.1 hypothetical protein EN859_027980 [Mesorhizobium sp. M00.F.Ca.ET.216.01.1.1]
MAPPAAKASQEMTARERFDFHLAEMKKAAIEINPLVRFAQDIECLDKPERPLALGVLGQWATGRYEGDGVYAGGDQYSRRPLQREAARHEGLRRTRFSVIQVHENDRRKWMRLSESSFEAFIGKKVTA